MGQKALQDIFGLLKKDAFGKHAISVKGRGGERTYDSKAYEFGDPFYLDLNTTLGNAMLREGAGEERRPARPVRRDTGRDQGLHDLLVELKPEDFQVFSTEYMTQSSTCLLIDMSRSMLLRGCFLAAKKVALALNHLIRSQFPKDDLYIIGFSGYARELKPEMLPVDGASTSTHHCSTRGCCEAATSTQVAQHAIIGYHGDQRPTWRRRGVLQLPDHLRTIQETRRE